MKILEFWKLWYFTRQQRWGVLALVLFAILLLVLKGNVAQYISDKRETKLAEISKIKFDSLKSQIHIEQQNYYAHSKKEKEWSKKDQNLYAETKLKKEEKVFTKKNPVAIDINAASKEDWKQLKGIGETLSARILTYRNKLGGFHSIEQVAEVYGVKDSLFQAIRPYLKLKKATLTKISLNNSDTTLLMNHPYISKTLAKQMVGYREKVKRYETVEDVKKLYKMNDSLFVKLSPYLVVD